MNITLYKLSKFTKSTKRPAGATPQVTITNVKLLQPTDILEPVFDLLNTNALNGYNYLTCEIEPGILRYYRIINKTVLTNEITRIFCKNDALATLQDVIKASSQYVSRTSDTSKQYPYVTDMAYPAQTNALQDTVYNTQLCDPGTGFYVIGIAARISSNTLARGSIQYVAMTKAQLMSLIGALANVQLTLADINPLQYIASAVFIPYLISTISDIGQTVQSVNAKIATVDVGGVATDISLPLTCHFISTGHIVTSVFNDTITLPDHPFITYHPNSLYLNYSPWTRYQINAGPFGSFDLPIEMLEASTQTDERKLNIDVELDLCSGEASIIFRNGTNSNNHLITKINAALGCDIKLIQQSNYSARAIMELMGQTTNGISSVASSKIIGAISGTLVGAGNLIMSAYEAQIPRLSQIGNNGSMAIYSTVFLEITATYNVQTSPDPSTFGVPCMGNEQISGFADGSFILTQNARLECAYLETETAEACSIMDSGFYLET